MRVRDAATLSAMMLALACRAKVEPQRTKAASATPAPEAADAAPADEAAPGADGGQAPGEPKSKPDPDEPGYSPEMTTGKYVDLVSPTKDIQAYHEPPLLAGIRHVESPKGAPQEIGCADGQREGFANVEKFPTIAGCLGSWKWAPSLRRPPSGTPCGDDLGECEVPADVCAPGWHPCGRDDGNTRDLTERIGPDECDAAGPGRFNAAFSHTDGDQYDGCLNSTSYACFNQGFGAESVCCGAHCEFGECRDGVWKARTRISRGVAEGCGLVSSARNGGVLCCTDVAL